MKKEALICCKKGMDLKGVCVFKDLNKTYNYYVFQCQKCKLVEEIEEYKLKGAYLE